jgi:hypothetical protein
VAEGGSRGLPVVRCPTGAANERLIGADCALHATSRFLAKDGDSTTADWTVTHRPARLGASSWYCAATLARLTEALRISPPPSPPSALCRRYVLALPF